MANEQIKKYFSTGIERGFSIEVLKENLLKNGFEEEEINEAIEEVINQASEEEGEEVRERNPTNYRKVLLYVIIGLIIIVAIWLIITLLQEKNSNVDNPIEEDAEFENFVNNNITQVSCDGSYNQLLVNPSEALSFLQINNSEERELQDLNENNLIEKSFTIGMIGNETNKVVQTYGLLGEENFSETIIVTPQNTQFLTLTKFELNKTSIIDRMINQWSNQTNKTIQFYHKMIYSNTQNQTMTISYVCKSE